MLSLNVLRQYQSHLIDKLLPSLCPENTNVKLAGLGARDSLRIEAGLCLYGNDIDEKTSPIEASLLWTISKTRRTAENASYPGADRILGQLAKRVPVERKRVGLRALSAGPPARQGVEIRFDNRTVGQITSGCPSPVLKQNIAVGYVDSELAKIGTKLACQIRNKSYEYELTKMPFVPTNYYLPPKKN